MAKSQHNFDNGLLIKNDDRLNPTELELKAAGTTNKKTILQTSHTDNRTLTLPDGTDTLLGKDLAAIVTNKTMSGASNTFSNIAYSSLVLTSSIVNADINASAAIAYSKLSLSNSIVNADINASAAIVYSKLSLSNSIVNADINASAAIAYSKLSLSNSIVNADISASAAIAYSKLSLSNSIVNADISSSAAIAYSKLAALNVSIVPVTNASGFLTSSSVTSTEIGYVSGVTSAIQTQLNNKASTTLNNLDTTSINVDLLPNITNTINIGSNSLYYNNIYTKNLYFQDINGYLTRADSSSTLILQGGAGGLNVRADSSLSGSGLSIYTTNNAGNTKTLSISTGTSSSGNSGSLSLYTGTAAGTRGRIVISTNTMQIGNDLGSSFYEQEYLHSTALSASQTNTVISTLTFASSSFYGATLEILCKEATTNTVEMLTMLITTNGTTLNYTIIGTNTTTPNISFSATLNGSNVEIRYSSGANTGTARINIKRFKAI